MQGQQGLSGRASAVGRSYGFIMLHYAADMGFDTEVLCTALPSALTKRARELRVAEQFFERSSEQIGAPRRDE